MDEPDIEATITFLPSDNGGRAGPAFSGYRPQFFYDGHDWDAVQFYPDVEQVNPGDTVRVYLIFLSLTVMWVSWTPVKSFSFEKANERWLTGRSPSF